MKVSVILPYYNDREFLRTSIESILNQTFEDFELILVNHATKDDCREIAHSYKDSRIVHVDIEKNFGAGGGIVFQAFLDNAKGEYIKTFCADDIMLPDCLSMLVDYMETHKDKDFAFGNVEYVDKKENSLNTTWFESRYGFDLYMDETECIKKYLKCLSIFPYIGCIIKRDVFDYIHIDKTMIATFDMSLWLSFLIKGFKVGFVDECIAKYRVHDEQMCSIAKKEQIFRISDFENLSFLELFYGLKNKKLFRAVFNNNPFIEKLSDIDETDMEFIISYEFLKSLQKQHRYIGYIHLNKLLQDDTTRKILEQKYNFGILEFRKIYSKDLFAPLEYIYKSSVKDMLYVILKRFLTFITFRQYFNKHKRVM